MSHFARIDENNIVQEVIRITQDVLDTGIKGDPAQWIQTSYNTRAGIHYGPDGQPDGGTALRMNYAGIGYTYDPVLDMFYEPKPDPSATLDTNTGTWILP